MLHTRQTEFVNPCFPECLLPMTENAVFFDIETTGLSASSSIIFMIGIASWKAGHGTAGQWLLEDISAGGEAELIQTFMNTLKELSPDILYVYNGRSFDVPFLQKRCQALGIDCPLNNYTIIDLYRELIPYKKIFQLKNYKLKSIESYLGFHRQDKVDGKELIRMYFMWKQTKDPALLNLLFLHNLDDLRGFIHIFSIVLYMQFFNGGYNAESAVFVSGAYRLTLALPNALPVPVAYEQFGICLTAEAVRAFITFPVTEKGIRYYYKDCKNYVYLPEEDMALHKSMAAYIEKSHYIAATPDKCYTYFLPAEDLTDHPDTLKRLADMAFDLFGLLGKKPFFDIFYS